MQQPHSLRKAALVQGLLMATLFAGAFRLKPPAPSPEVVLPPLPAPIVPVPPEPLPDFASIADVDVKKQRFFDFLQPYIDAKNGEVQRERLRLMGLIEKLQTGYSLDPFERSFMLQLSHYYEVPTDDLNDRAFQQLLLRRVDVIPPSLVLAQAANESAWGTSRFAQEGYNLFGQWCYQAGCGLVPDNRRPGDNHEVKSFASVEAAVDAYFQNLNTFPSYQYLRRIRQDLRLNELPIDGISLSEGLRSYSERGDEYIEELRRMIWYNDLLERDGVIL